MNTNNLFQLMREADYPAPQLAKRAQVLAQLIYTDCQNHNENIAKELEKLVEWQFCDCGCPLQRKPLSKRDIELTRIVNALRLSL